MLTEYKREGQEWVLRVFIDHPDGVTLDHCGQATHLVADALEENDPIATAYRIEVSSPGVDRPLVKLADFERFLSERVFVKTHKAFEGSKKFTGTLLACSAESVRVLNEHDQKEVDIPFELISKATLKPILNFS
ncbi:ribosome maturation factor RimP [Acanthopleuribacter pedis]|uniref:Ribosome maturation factor RimP n=1 Tax=Acanthopleuribacter pedis TaxID=442870 RepID=A0A8J7PYH2_9BACT|nr:ribosome maturation factor RimP [Acanthopleuribacter pedis]